MDKHTLESFVAACKPIAVEAGEKIAEIAQELGEVQDKADGSPLTKADMASHETIMAGLKTLEPAIPILSEEGDLESISREAWRTFWCVDPLDGTKEFIQNLPDYTVNIALIDGGDPILGVIYVPARGDLYFAVRGVGAFKAASGGAARAIAARRSQKAQTAVVSRSHLSPETEQFLARLGVGEMVKRGSSVKICAVAEGAADIYPRFGPTCLWDTAAGTAIARAAGCRVVDLQGQDLSYDPAAGLKRPGFIVYPAGLLSDDGLRELL